MNALPLHLNSAFDEGCPCAWSEETTDVLNFRETSEWCYVTLLQAVDDESVVLTVPVRNKLQIDVIAAVECERFDTFGEPSWNR